MSTPLFIREPVAGELSIAITRDEIIAENDEAILIEEIKYGTSQDETVAGAIIVWLEDPDGNERRIIRHVVDAQAAGDYAFGSIDVNVTIPVGWKMLVSHDIKQSDNVTDATFEFVALGGIVR
jgi:hypothetical protein